MMNYVSLPKISSDGSILRFVQEESYDVQKQQHLKLVAFISGNSSLCTKQTLIDNNFVIRKDKKPRSFQIGWGCPKSTEFYQQLPKNAIYFQVPGCSIFGRKDNLARLMKHTQLIPETYILPEQAGNAFKALNTGIFLYKPALQARGNGIKIMSANSKIPKQRAAVLQKYVKPVLVNGFKFDLRMYVFLSSVDPLIVYLYDDGIARFATQKWQKPSRDNKNQKRMHLTNYAVNKEDKKAKYNQQEESTNEDDDSIEEIAYKQLANDLFKYLDQNRSVFDEVPIENTIDGDGKVYSYIKAEIEKAVQQIFILSEPKLNLKGKMAKTSLAIPRKVAAMYGVDIVITRTCQIQILEVNVQCSTGTSTELDKKLKYPLMKTIFDIVGVRLSGDTLAPIMSQSEGQQQIDLTKITDYEKRVIWQLYDEEKRCGLFKRILPDINIQYCENRYLTRLIIDWIKSGREQASLIEQIQQ